MYNIKLNLLDGFSLEEKMEFMSLGVLREYYLHDVIISEKRDDPSIYLILDGEVSLWKRNVPIFHLKPGDVFNEVKIFLPKHHFITAMAESKSSILRFNRNEILNFFHLKPERLFKIFMLNFVMTLLRRIDGYEDKLIDYYFHLI